MIPGRIATGSNKPTPTITSRPTGEGDCEAEASASLCLPQKGRTPCALFYWCLFLVPGVEPRWRAQQRRYRRPLLAPRARSASQRWPKPALARVQLDIGGRRTTGSSASPTTRESPGYTYAAAVG